MTGAVFVEMVVTGHRTPDTGDHQSLAIMYTNNGDSEDKDKGLCLEEVEGIVL